MINDKDIFVLYLVRTKIDLLKYGLAKGHNLISMLSNTPKLQ